MSTLTEFLKGIADAIRTKKGTTATIPAQNFATEITNLPSGSNALAKRVDNTITEVTAEDLEGATQIMNYAFYGCTSLASIEMPNSITSIGAYAFSNCTSLASIEMPNSITSISAYTFYICTSLTSIEIPDSVTSIGAYAFYGCTSLTSIEIPDGVTSIGNYAFQSCTSLTSIEIPDGVTTIGNSAFYVCGTLTSVVMGDSVTSIGNYAFWGCRALAVVDFRSATAVPTLGTSVFGLTSSTLKIVVPDALYDEWIVATNWASIASKIVKASEYTG